MQLINETDSQHFLAEHSHSHLTSAAQIEDMDYFERERAVLCSCMTNTHPEHKVIEEIVLDLL